MTLHFESFCLVPSSHGPTRSFSKYALLSLVPRLLILGSQMIQPKIKNQPKLRKPRDEAARDNARIDSTSLFSQAVSGRLTPEACQPGLTPDWGRRTSYLDVNYCPKGNWIWLFYY